MHAQFSDQVRLMDEMEVAAQESLGHTYLQRQTRSVSLTSPRMAVWTSKTVGSLASCNPKIAWAELQSLPCLEKVVLRKLACEM